MGDEQKKPDFDEWGLEDVKIPPSELTWDERALLERRKQFLTLRLGWDAVPAALAASVLYYDLREAIYLFRHGCPPHIASYICSPYEGGEVPIPKEFPSVLDPKRIDSSL